MQRFSMKVWVLLAVGVALNYIGGNIALFLRLPIYLDSIGTIFCAFLLGPIFGMLTGLASGLLGGITTDLFSLYYIPVAMCTGVMAGLVYRRYHKLWQVPLQAIVIMVPGTLLSSLITYYLFGGITSSGSSIIVQIIYGLGLSKFWSIVLVQIVTDYCDRLLAVVVAVLVLTAIPVRLKQSVLQYKTVNK